MKRSHLPYLIIPILGIQLVLNTGCTYEPEIKTFTEIAEVDYSKVVLDIADIDDTLEVSEPIDLVCTFDMDYRKPPVINVSLDEAQVEFEIDDAYDSWSNTAPHRKGEVFIRIDPRDYENGIYLLNVTSYTNTGSGSLADRTESEFIEFQYSVPVKIDTTSPKAINDLKAYIEDGYLKLSWSPIDTTRIKYIQLEYNGLTKKLDHLSDTLYVDKYYSGGQRSYRVNAYTYYKKIQSNEVVRSDSIKITARLTSTNEAMISWDSIPFYNSDIELRISMDGTTIYESTDLKSNKFTHSYPFALGSEYYYSLDLGKYWASSNNIHIGTKFFEFSQIAYSPEKNIIYTLTENDNGTSKISKINARTMEVIIQREYDNLESYLYLNISPNGDHVYLHKYGAYIFAVNQNDLSLSPIEKTMIPNARLSSVSDNNLMFFRNSTWYYDTTWFYVYDYDRDVILWQDSLMEDEQTVRPTKFYYYDLSKTGEYFILEGQVFKRFGDSYSYIWTLPVANDASGAKFSSTQEETLYLYSNSNNNRKLNIYNVNTMQLIKSFDNIKSYILDPDSERLIAKYPDGTMKLINLNTDEITDFTMEGVDYFFNSKIISSDGYYIEY